MDRYPINCPDSIPQIWILLGCISCIKSDDFQFWHAFDSLSQVQTHRHTHTTILRPFFRDHPGELVPEENFWTLWCQRRLTEADTDHLAERHSIRTNQCPPPPSAIFCRPDALPAAQLTVSEHWRHKHWRHTVRYNTDK